jgi:hypothetical protein
MPGFVPALLLARSAGLIGAGLENTVTFSGASGAASATVSVCGNKQTANRSEKLIDE